LLSEKLFGSDCSGKLIFHLFGALAEFERNLIRERTKAGLAAARARGRLGGRKPALSKNQQEVAVRLYYEKEHTVYEICRIMGISKPTLYSYIHKAEGTSTENVEREYEKTG